MRKVSNKRLEKIIRNCCYYVPRYKEILYRILEVEKNGFHCINEDSWTGGNSIPEVKILFKDIDLSHDEFYTMKEYDIEVKRI